MPPKAHAADPSPRRPFSSGGHPYQAVVGIPLSGVDVRLGVRIQDKAVAAIEFLISPLQPHSPTNAVAADVVRQLKAYFEDPQQRFSLPILPQGTAFQRRVWTALRAIPVGETVTYGELAREVGGGARAVGGACRRNPCPIVVPCHRVVSVKGLGGFMGETAGAELVLKARLLTHEAGASQKHALP